MKSPSTRVLAAIFLFLSSAPLLAGTGTEGASFLNTPVGAEPAAMAGAYSALASNAYAPVWNPGALGRVDSPQLTAQYLSSLETLSDTHVAFVFPHGKAGAFGASLRYLGSGDITATDNTGNAAGKFSSHYGAYALSYGRALNNKISLGLSGKVIEAKIADVGAKAYAVDFGTLYQATEQLSLAGVVTNLGSDLTFIEQHDPLPVAFHLAGAYTTKAHTVIALEGVRQGSGLTSLHAGVEWNPLDKISLRVGYRTDTLKGLSPLAGLTTGIGIKLFDQSFSIAWLPLGDLGSSEYVSLLMRFNYSSKKKPPVIPASQTPSNQ